MDVAAPGYATNYSFDAPGAAPPDAARAVGLADASSPPEPKGLPSPGEILRMNAARGGGAPPPGAPPPRALPRTAAPAMRPRTMKQKPKSAQEAAADAAARALSGGGGGGGGGAADPMAMFAGAGFKSAADRTTAKDMSERERRAGWEDFNSRVNNA